MTAITLFFLRKQLEGDVSFDPKHARMLDTIWDSFQTLFPENLDAAGQVMLFRFGRADDIKYGTLRKSAEAFLI